MGDRQIIYFHPLDIVFFHIFDLFLSSTYGIESKPGSAERMTNNINEPSKTRHVPVGPDYWKDLQ
jgi:hypothetical protein